MTDLHYLTLSDVCRRVKSGEFTSVQVTEALLTRVDALDDELRSFARVTRDQALQTAERLDGERHEGKPLGALHGVPIAVKDLLDTRGVITASGTKVMSENVPEEDATVVARLQEAGAVIIGKTQLTEGAFSTHHPDIGPPRNPWNRDHWPGVSSSGSGVSVAAGLAYGALGSDTGGSIRFPSAACGLVGIKPTYGRVSRHGAFPLAESLDHIGPMTRNVEDAARMLQVIAGVDPRDATTIEDSVPNYSAMLATSVQGFRIGVDWEYVSTGVDPAVVDVVRDAIQVFQTLGADVDEVTLPAAYRRLIKEWGITCSVECVRAHRATYPSRKADYGPILAGFLDAGLAADREAYDALEALRVEFRSELDALLDRVDALIVPTMISPTPTWESINKIVQSDDEIADFITFTSPFNYSGHPTITLPAGLDGDGLPKSCQLVGRWLGEPSLIRAGSAYEAELGFDEHPLP